MYRKKNWIRKSVSLMLVAALVISTLTCLNATVVEAAGVKKPAKVKSVQAYPAKSDGIKVTWKKVAGVSGYQVCRSTKKSGGFKAVKKLGASKASYTNTGLEVDTRYYYKVRAYTKKGGKTKWGSYSSVKSAVVGAKGLAAYGLKPNVKLNKSYTYKTPCWNNRSKTTTGTAKFSGYKRVNTKDGYDRITLTISVTLKDSNAAKYGVSYAYSATDYYSYKKGGKDADLYDGNHESYSIEYDGKVYDDCNVTFSENKEWKGTTWVGTFILDARVPNDYDGIVAWVAAWPVNGNLNGMAKDLNTADNLLMFRCN